MKSYTTIRDALQAAGYTGTRYLTRALYRALLKAQERSAAGDEHAYDEVHRSTLYTRAGGTYCALLELLHD